MGIYVTGIGVVSPLGRGWEQTATSLMNNRCGIAPLTLFPHARPFAVGEMGGVFSGTNVPRTHQAALLSAKDALQACGGKLPEAVIVGVTTGGMPKTEVLLRSGADDPGLFRYHAAGSVAEYIADVCGCRGPALTVSTACSSGAAAVALGARLLEAGRVGSVLAGGADALCRMTLYGFNALQLLSPAGARPFDRDRDGMSLSEAAAMLFMESSEEIPDRAKAEILGIGLSCDAHHPASPHPEGRGALEAMDAAIREAGLACPDIDYISLHGTGTISNDASEASAINRLFGAEKPRLSSIKGAAGHSLGAAGAVELAVCIISIAENRVFANYGTTHPDPALGLRPQTVPESCSLKTVLSNSFGFGGNNAALVVGRPRSSRAGRRPGSMSMRVSGYSCVTGAGPMKDTAPLFLKAGDCAGMYPLSELSAGFPPADIRRLKRLPRLALRLAKDAVDHAGLKRPPSGVFFGTGWGALTETADFLGRLFKSGERFSSPTDFVGSVHNAPAGEIAMMFGVTGPNVTMTGGDASFEQALMAACMLGGDTGEPFFVVGADERHERLSPLFDPSVACGGTPADGGGGLCLLRESGGVQVRPLFYRRADAGERGIRAVIEGLGGEKAVRSRYGALFAGIPASRRSEGEKQIRMFAALTGSRAPVIDYRKHTGEFASASAAGVSLAALCLEKGLLPPQTPREEPVQFVGGAVLVIGTGEYVTAVEVFGT